MCNNFIESHLWLILANLVKYVFPISVFVIILKLILRLCLIAITIRKPFERMGAWIYMRVYRKVINGWNNSESLTQLAGDQNETSKQINSEQ